MIMQMPQMLLDVFTEKGSDFWLPGPRSRVAEQSDWAWHAVLITSLIFFVIVVGAMTYFAIKYRRRSVNDKVSTVTHNTTLEITWTLIPLILVMWFFFVGFKVFLSLDNPPSNAIPIQVEARQWSFAFTYPGGGSSGDLYVPVGQPVRLNMQSIDVTHALYIPNFRIGKNVIPGRTTEIWFEATELSGDAGFPIYCTQYCGKSHSTMMSRVIVMQPQDYQRKIVELANVFKKDNKPVAYAQVGEGIYQARCFTCHTIDGSKNTGPTWKGLWKRDHKFSASNEPNYTLMASDPDDKWIRYIAESIVHPAAKIVDTFPNQMSSFDGEFSDNAAATPDKEYQDYYKYQKVLAVIEYMKKISQGAEYDPSKAPTFREPGSPATGAAAVTGSATTTSPNGKP